MPKYKITIEYDGSDFFGWQRQKNKSRTVQETIENALFKILNEKISVTGAGRTDAGVHAYSQTAHFNTERELQNDKFLYSLNSVLPPTITIKTIKKVKDDFHARYSAKKREYKYFFTKNRKSISYKYFHKLNYELDFTIIDEFIKMIIGYNCFKSFCKNKTDKHNFYCRLESIKYKIKKEEIIFTLTADRFLHSMVRAILGCILDIGRHKININEIKDKFIKGEKIKTTYLPANALFLNKIFY